MCQYKNDDKNITIILGYITSVVGYNEGADTFDVYSTDNGEPAEIPNELYDDFMNKLRSYAKSQVQ